MSKILVNCPVCNGEKTAKSTTKIENIPHFGEVLEFSLVCDLCGYKHNDIISLDQKDPVRHEVIVNKNNFSSRVVKSQSATVSIPELGLKVEPGAKSIAYISNIEGVLERFKNAVNQALSLFQDLESQKNGKNILNKLNNLLKGEGEVTLIIEDPFGNSNIVDSNAKSRPLTEEELKGLKTGFSIINNSE